MNEELRQALTAEVKETIAAGGSVHPNDAFDLAYHAGQILGLDMAALERQTDMSVTLDKRVSLVKQPHPLFKGGHNAESSYTPNADGSVPEWVLIQRRAQEGQARISMNQAGELSFNELPRLADFFGKRL